MQWRRVVNQSLGVNILEDYYMGEFFRGMMTQWVTNNVGLIKSVPQTTLTELRNIVQEGWQSGLVNRDIAKKIQDAYGINKRKADFWARDQMAKLNGDMQEQQQKDAGVKEYVWSTTGNEKVRGDPTGLWPNPINGHYQLDGKRCRWDDPTVYFSNGEWVPRTIDMTKKHPKKDYECHCVGLPVFNFPELSLPWEGEAQ